MSKSSMFAVALNYMVLSPKKHIPLHKSFILIFFTKNDYHDLNDVYW